MNNTDEYHETAFVLQTAPNDSDSTRAQSYLGLLAIDKSRYENTNQIPNLRIGFDVLRVGSATSVNGTYGTFKVENGKVVYTPTKVVDGVEKTVYYQAKLGNDTLKSQIKLAPASNFLYEENMFAVNNSSTGVAWTNPVNTSATNNYQGVLAENETEVYGYDSSYGKSNYSNGIALESTVTSTNKRSKILTFTFTGTGFDLYSVCGPTTGVKVVSLKNNDTNTMVKSYIVDTYYGDSAYGTLYQVPIISENELTYGNYTVQVVASYLPTMSGALNTSAVTEAVDGNEDATVTTAIADRAELRKALAELGLADVLETAAVTSLLNVVDSVRVYNPLNGDADVYSASETNAKYYNIMDNLINSKTDGTGTIVGGGKYVAYVSGTAEQEITVDNYNSIGPKDELYIAKIENQTAVTFTVNGFNRDSMKVMVSLRAAYGTPKAKIGGNEIMVSSNNEMYYDITGYVADDGKVTIQNSAADASLLSVVAIKITSETMDAAALSTDFNLMTARTMMMAPATEVEPNAPVLPEEPEEPVVPEEPEVPSEPEVPEEPDDTAKSWFIRLIEWVIATFNKIFAQIKTVLGF